MWVFCNFYIINESMFVMYIIVYPHDNKTILLVELTKWWLWLGCDCWRYTGLKTENGKVNFANYEYFFTKVLLQRLKFISCLSGESFFVYIEKSLLSYTDNFLHKVERLLFFISPYPNRLQHLSSITLFLVLTYQLPSVQSISLSWWHFIDVNTYNCSSWGRCQTLVLFWFLTL